MATKEEKAAAKAEKETFALLKKDAKKLKIDFDKDTTLAELQVLVDAAKSAAQAQADKEAEGATGFATSSPNNVPAKTGTEEAPVSQAPAVVTDPTGDRVLNQHKTRGGDLHILAERGNGYVIKNQHGIVNATFDVLADAQHYMENLSRF